MKKVLVITNYFPPCNMTAAHRASAWAKYLKGYGYYPIIITRHWTREVKNNKDLYISSPETLKHEVFDDYEIYRLPYHPNAKERAFVDHRYTSKQWIYFALKIWDSILEKFSNSSVSLQNLYNFSLNYLQNNPEIKQVVITGKPFILFKFGYLLNRKLGVDWIADYRDDWTTNELADYSGFLRASLQKLDRFFEKKWVSSSAAFTSVTPLYVNRIQQLTGQTGHLMYNGYFEEDYPESNTTASSENFTIVYSGTLYAHQKIEIFLEALKQVIERHSNGDKVKVYFIGLAYDHEQSTRVKNIMTGYENQLIITARIENKEVIQLMQNAQLLLYTSYADLKGIIPSKIFEYIACKKPILLCPSDEDICEQIIQSTELGIVANDVESTRQAIADLLDKYVASGSTDFLYNETAIQNYSRRKQSKVLAEILNNLPSA